MSVMEHTIFTCSSEHLISVKDHSQVTEGRKLVVYGVRVHLTPPLSCYYQGLEILASKHLRSTPAPHLHDHHPIFLLFGALVHYSGLLLTRLSLAQPTLHPEANQSGCPISLLKTIKYFPITSFPIPYHQHKIQAFYLLHKALPEGPGFLQLPTKRHCLCSGTEDCAQLWKASGSFDIFAHVVSSGRKTITMFTLQASLQRHLLQKPSLTLGRYPPSPATAPRA